MTSKMLRRAETLAQARQKHIVDAVAERLKQVLASGSVEVQGSQVIVRGRDLLKRWLSDPDLRFLPDSFK